MIEKYLPEVCKIQYGFPFDSSQFSTDEGMPLIRIRDVVRGYSETFTTEKYKEEYVVHQNDLLVGMDGEFNIAKWGKTPALLNQRVCRLIPFPEEIDKNYLFYFMPSALKRIEEKTPFVTVKHLSAKELNKIVVTLPPLDEQRRIAAVLDKVTDLFAQRRAQLEKLDLLVKSRFVEMFGDLTNPNCPYKKYKLVDVCADSDDIKCGPFGTQLSKQEYQDHGVALWEIPQINSYFSTPPTHFLTQEKAAQLNAFSIIPGDIVMSRKGNVGRCALFPSHFDNGIMHSDVLRIRVDKQRVNPCFMMYQLHFSRAVQHQIEVVSTGAIMAGVNVTKLKNIVIHLPDLDQQESFCSFVQKKDMLKNSINESLKYLGILKQSLMQQYFE